MNGEQPAETAAAAASVYRQHSRLFEDNRFVYPVVSRRSEGVSIGVNLNPDKVCNFDCIYCQVDRRSESETRFVEMAQLLDELRSVLELVQSGELFEHPKFENTPTSLRRLNDIAFSGDGEPTTFRNFDDIIEQAAAVKRDTVSNAVKMVLITNASMFHRPHVQRGLQLLDEDNGQIWAKLDAGTEEYFKLIDRTKIPFQQILDNITLAAQQRPILIQSLFMTVHGTPPDDHEIAEFCQRLAEVVAAGGQLKLIQIYTVARQPAESFVGSLTEQQLNSIAERVHSTTGLATAVYP
ncbi:radical SAM protein [Fuerstiella marisgermanici]|uniref:Radical SAM superfamily protein n=1 Tax=Fuerstiella marisgermanici TaxID=1891926 RepID=A0A1P8WC26_9PLAN|nr:radical SAM protein [Fuerstiella marisgermanici]APZ91618.1 Radical SAM superfamily protein [Fuerstiella marisgermanici]